MSEVIGNGLNTEVRGLSEDDSGNSLVGVDLDIASTTSGKRPGDVFVGSIFLGGGDVLGASDGLGVTSREFVSASALPVILARSVDIVPGIHEALIGLVAVRV